MSIFAKPEEIQSENSYGVRVLFLHGLEGRGPRGTKATCLSGEWAALCPTLRTQELSELRYKCSGVWSNISREEIDECFETPYSDALAAVKYAKPDLIVGSSMGAAILFKLIAEGHYSGMAVFCAPAIQNLLGESYVAKTLQDGTESFKNSVWLLGEMDTVVSNKHNISVANRVGGNVIMSPRDGHRLNKAVESNILNSAVLTALELHESL